MVPNGPPIVLTRGLEILLPTARDVSYRCRASVAAGETEPKRHAPSRADAHERSSYMRRQAILCPERRATAEEW